jgi:capsular exopolysaccharide synthesis family protein
VLLVDADLRKPTLHRQFNLANELGLSNLLRDTSSDAASIIPHKQVPSLFVLSAGAAQPMAAELLGSSRMRELMTSWRAQYDYIVLDTPPILAVTDAIRLTSMADSALLITRLGQTPRDALARTCDILNQEQIPVLGIVVNGVNPRSPGSYYYGYYPELSKTYYHNEMRS